MDYPPISAYALLSDCHSAALVSPDGSVDWCCFERFDARSVFGRLLDWRRGDPALRYCHYVDDTEHADLVAATGLRELESYRADGDSGDVNRYSILVLT